MRRLFVLELNEIPLRVFRWHAENNPGSPTARLLEQAAVGESLADEDLPRDLYPSQSWASLATGVPFEEHGVFWYGDPKPDRFPLYWQAAADSGVSTGVFGTLHSSPLKRQCVQKGIRFAIPDAFAPDAETVPERFEPLQAFNLDMTRANGRAVTSRTPWRRYGQAPLALARTGLAPSTSVMLGRLAVEVATGRVNKERLRVGQFHLMADQFTRLAGRADPDLTVFFTNHIASAMHRYWYANFPDDWDDAIYPPEWARRFADEIPYAMRSLDHWLRRWMTWVERTGRTMLIVSSMGQHGGDPVDTAETSTLVVTDPVRFGRALGLPDRFSIGNAMVPQTTFLFESSDDAGQAALRLNDVDVDSLDLQVDRHQNAVTVSYQSLPPEGTVAAEKVVIDGQVLHLDDAGLQRLEVEAHRAATHHPAGSVIVYNSPTASVPNAPISYFGIAPAILSSLGIDPLPHHRATELRL